MSIRVLVLATLLGACSPGLPTGGIPLRVASDASLSRIDDVPLERYLAGVLAREVGPRWPIEALKAQAVASRTYALYRKEHPRDERYDVVGDTSDQVYHHERHGISPAIIRAVRETAGEVLTHEGRIFPAYFHSACGGMSEESEAVWPGSSVPPVMEVHQDPWCEANPNALWTYSVTKDSLRELFDLPSATGQPLDLTLLSRDASGRVSRVEIRSGRKVRTESGAAFRKRLGYTNLKSTLFDVTDDGESLIFTGRGSGHGVGLCQWGSRGMAEAGKSYREILGFYYPGATLTGMPLAPPDTEASQEDSVESILQNLDDNTKD